MNENLVRRQTNERILCQTTIVAVNARNAIQSERRTNNGRKGIRKRNDEKINKKQEMQCETVNRRGKKQDKKRQRERSNAYTSCRGMRRKGKRAKQRKMIIQNEEKRNFHSRRRSIRFGCAYTQSHTRSRNDANFAFLFSDLFYSRFYSKCIGCNGSSIDNKVDVNDVGEFAFVVDARKCPKANSNEMFVHVEIVQSLRCFAVVEKKILNRFGSSQ